MTLPLFLADPGELEALTAGAEFVLDGTEGRHAATVKRLHPGETLWVGDGAGRRVTGTVIDAGGGELRMKVTEVVVEVRPNPSFTLVQALAKGERDELAIEAATEIGVDRIVPWQAERSIVQWKAERAGKARQKWVDLVRAAAKQSRRAWVPEVLELASTAALAQRIERACATFLLHGEAGTDLAAQPLPGAGEVLIVVGPEGGISPAELATFTAAGGTPVRLGTNVLRSSTAGPAALAVLSAAERWQ